MIHPTAIIGDEVILAESVEVGPYAVLEGPLEVGEGTRIEAHAVIRGPTRIGRDNHIYQFASIGDAPQDKKYAGEPTELVIGDGNTIREYVTINRGTVQDAGVTRIGNDNWIMAYVHIAHDCQVGDHTIFANNASLAGHVHVDDHAILGGFTLVHQFCSIGAHAFTAFGSAIAKDVPPFVMVGGHPVRPHGLNTEGLRRRGFSEESIRRLKQAYRILYRQGLSYEEALARLKEMAGESDEVRRFVDFLESRRRGIVR